MGKKKQRKGAPDFDDDEFPEPSSDPLEPASDSQTPLIANKKQSKPKKAKKGKAKDSGWGSDDEAVAEPAAAADVAKPANQKSARKQVASAFDLLDEDAEQDDASPTSALHDIEKPANGRLQDDHSGNDSSSNSEDDQGNGLVVAEIISVKPHPNADRLKVCSVDYGHDVAQVVTNAGNAAAGMKVIFAGIDAQLAGSGLIIKKTAVRGVDSFGMLCSAHDIGWSDEADGVLFEMPGSAEPGDPCPANPPKVAKKATKGKAGKKGKAASKLPAQDSDDDEPVALRADSQHNDSDELHAQPAARKPKKGKKKQAANFADLGDSDDGHAALDDTQLSDDAKPVAATAAQKKKKGKKKQAAASGGFAALGDTDDEDAAPAEVQSSDEEEAASAAAASKSTKSKTKQASKTGNFAALGISDDDEAQPAEEADLPVAAPAQKPKRGKKQGFNASTLAASDGEDSDSQAAAAAAANGDTAHGDEDAPVAATRKKGKKKGFDASSAFAALEVDEEAAQGAETAELDTAEPEATSVRKPKKGKKKSMDPASAFAALSIDNEAELDTAVGADTSAVDAEDAPVAAAPVRKSKKGKKQADAAAAFAALGLEDDDGANAVETPTTDAAEQLEEPVTGKVKKSKKGKKPAADMDAVFAALNGDEDTVPADTHANGLDHGTQDLAAPSPDEDGEQPAAEPAKRKGKKKKGKAADTEDIDALLAEIGEAPPQTDAAAAANADGTAAAAEAPSPEPAKGKGKKKKKGKAAADTEDIDALLAELDGPAAPSATAAAASAADTSADEQADAEPTSAQLDSAQPAAEPATAVEGGKGKKKKKKGKGGGAKEEEDLDAVLAELGMAPAAKTEAGPAADEAEAPADTAAAADEAGGDDDDAADAGGNEKEMTAAEKKKAKKKAREKAKKAGDAEGAEAAAPAAKKGGKKVSAAVRKMQEEVEARQRAEAEAARLAEEQRIWEEQEEKRREEEERKKKENTERRKVERLERRAQLKREGKLLTGKAKKEAERLAAVREQFLKQAGLETPADVETAQKKKVVYGKKKPAPKPKAASELEAQPSGAASEAVEDVAAVGSQAAAQSSISAAQDQAEQAKAEAVSAEGEQKAEQAEAAAVVQEAKEESPESEGEDWEAAAESWEDADADALPAIGPAAEAAKRKAAEADAKQPLQAGVDAPAAKKSKPEQEEEEAKPDAEAKVESDEESESEEESDSASDSEEDSDEESSSEYSSSEEETDSEEEAEQRLQAAKEKRQARLAEAIKAGSKDNLRSPICCILGHVDTGKTKLLDNVRRTNVQDGEAGGITQQIGATYVPDDALLTRTQALRSNGEEASLKLPGLLIIDTPGHESFTNLRSRGSSLCDIAILVVDMMHGLEQQTIESINLLKMRKTPFIVALNKIDRLFDWKSSTDAPIQPTLAKQKDHVRREFEERLAQSILNLNEQGLNVALYWKNPDKRKYVNVVPTSAITGEGIPDMLQLLVDLTQSMMASRLMVISETQCTVLEVKVIEGLGTTVDVVLVNGMLHEGDTIVLCGMGGPIVTQIRSLLTPHPLKELRVRGSYLHHKQIKAAQGVKIAAQNLESAVAGTQMLVAGPNDDIQALKDEVMEDMADIFSSVDRSGEGVCVQASTLGSLEALLEFLKSPAVKIPVSGINIGPVHKRDIMRASVMLEKGRKKFACLLAFDVAVTREARELSESLGVRVFTADIIYHLFDQFTAYLKTVKDEEQEAAKFDAVFPCILRILPNCVFNKKDPIVVGVDIEEGIAKIGTPLCIPTQGGIEIGRIASMELNHKPVDTAKRGESVAMKIEPHNAAEATRLYGRHFDFKDPLVSKISRKSIDLLKQHFKDDMSKDDWKLVIKLKSTFRID